MTAADFNVLLARAKAGDAEAQYRLAAALSQSGRAADAQNWLQSAAALGFAEAKYTLATQHLQSSAGVEEAFSLANEAARAGSIAAMRLLSIMYATTVDTPGNWNNALRLAHRAARAGDAHARLELGALLVLSGAAPFDAAIALIESALERDPIAAAFYLRLCAETGCGDTLLVSRYSALLENAGYPNMAALKAASNFPQNAAARPNAGDALDALSSDNAISMLSDALERWIGSRGERTELCASPRAALWRSALSAAACEYIIASSARRLGPSMTFDPQTGQSRLDAYRTSQTATLGVVDLDLPMAAIAERLALLSGRPAENGEFLSVLRYSPGEEYKPHFDWIPPGPDFDRGGQRVATALLYLNDNYSGGETHFITPDIKVRGSVGDVLVFENVTADGERDRNSRHASLPIATGEKWLVSRWFREKKYNF